MSSKILIPDYMVREYLDNHIRHWRRNKLKGYEAAWCYIDAYQNVRKALFGEFLEEESKQPGG